MTGSCEYVSSYRVAMGSLGLSKFSLVFFQGAPHPVCQNKLQRFSTSMGMSVEIGLWLQVTPAQSRAFNFFPRYFFKVPPMPFCV